MKKVVGISSIALFLLVSLQSCVALVVDVGGGFTGILTSFLMLIAGIIVLASRDSKGMLITAVVMYLIGGLMGVTNVGLYADLVVWGVLNLVFGALMIFELYRNWHIYNKESEGGHIE